jgi:hypothetical protein
MNELFWEALRIGALLFCVAVLLLYAFGHFIF